MYDRLFKRKFELVCANRHGVTLDLYLEYGLWFDFVTPFK